MSRHSIALLMFALVLSLSACTSSEEEQAKKKEAAAVVVPRAPAGTDDRAWKLYLQQVVSQNMSGVTDRVFPYYLPANSTVPTPGDSENRSQYDRQLDQVTSVISRTVLPGNMLVFGSPDSAKMGDLILAAFTGAKADALKGSQVLFIGKAEDNARVQAAVQAVGGKYIFIEAK
jgi:hypothetical protein